MSNVSATLIKLDLTGNRISDIDAVPKIEKLKYIILNANELTQFPDFKTISATLYELRLFDNSITFIAEDRITSLTSLTYLNILFVIKK